MTTRPDRKADERAQFSLAELLLLMTAVCVALGLASLLAPFRPVIITVATLLFVLGMIFIGLFVLPTLGSLLFASYLLGEDNRRAKRSDSSRYS